MGHKVTTDIEFAHYKLMDNLSTLFWEVIKIKSREGTSEVQKDYVALMPKDQATEGLHATQGTEATETPQFDQISAPQEQIGTIMSV